MAYSATLANHRGHLSKDEHRRLLDLFSRAGLTIDHPLFDSEVLDKGTEAILKTRDGKLRLAVPNPLGACCFINDVSTEQLNDALRLHKSICKTYPREGAGIEAYVDSSDTGYTTNDTKPTNIQEVVQEVEIVPIKGGPTNGANGSKIVNGTGGSSNGHENVNGDANGVGLLHGKAKEAILLNKNGYPKSTKVQA